MKKIICFLLQHRDGKSGVISIEWQEGFPAEYYFKGNYPLTAGKV